MKKIYILALMFFSVLCGQVSYGQTPYVIGEGGVDFDNWNDANSQFPADENGVHNMADLI
jgi:hypothetical protein